MSKKNIISLALGGGSVWGAAHIGVLKALEENKIKPGCIAGTSIGALVGALYAFGNKTEKIKELALTLSWFDISSISFPKLGLLSNDKLGKLIDDNIGNKRIEDSPIPLIIVASDITNGETVYLKKGNLKDAILASTAIPGVFTPKKIGGRMLVDGAVTENLPVTPVKEKCKYPIVAVYLNKYYNLHEPESILEVITNAYSIGLSKSTEHHSKAADVVLTPNLSKFSRVGTEGVSEMIEIGYSTALKEMENIKRLANPTLSDILFSRRK